MNKNYVFFNSNKKLLHVYICCARPNGRTVRHINKKNTKKTIDEIRTNNRPSSNSYNAIKFQRECLHVKVTCM